MNGTNETQKVSLGELLLNAGTKIVDLEKQSYDQVAIITHLENENASLREQLAKERALRKELVEGVQKFVHHWRIYFDSPKVGQPPNLSDLESLLQKSKLLDDKEVK